MSDAPELKNVCRVAYWMGFFLCQTYLINNSKINNKTELGIDFYNIIFRYINITYWNLRNSAVEFYNSFNLRTDDDKIKLLTIISRKINGIYIYWKYWSLIVNSPRKLLFDHEIALFIESAAIIQYTFIVGNVLYYLIRYVNLKKTFLLISETCRFYSAVN